MGTTLYSEKPAAATASPDPTLIKITSLAADKVTEIRQAEEIEDEMVLRLAVIGGGCSGFSYDLYFDEPTSLDREYTISGVKVAVDEMSLMYLVGTEIDYIEQLGGAGFKFHNPNVKATCGCGSSFAM